MRVEGPLVSAFPIAWPAWPRLRVVAVVALAALNAADLVTTRMLTWGREANPIAAWLLAHGSYLTLGIVKVLTVTALGVLALAAPRERRWVTAALWFVVVLYALAVTGNSAQLALQ
jgi:hypothetical protein